ncbi:MAG: hypothetical protein JW727_01905 [Candidatus Aenigmarchaeota archaeon]|nr:hypothetical protein [Candidatus Aenigmarchaeota archaeon]
MRQTFARSNLGKYKKLKSVWRRPKGIHNKLRHNKKGKGERPNIGLKQPKGEVPALVASISRLEELKGKTIILSGTVGKKKLAEMAEFCEKNKIKILNPPAKTKIKPKAKPKEAEKK